MPIKLCLAVLLCCLLACKSSSEDEYEYVEEEEITFQEYDDSPKSKNVLKSYINEPKDKAHGAKDAIEGIEKERQRQMDDLFD